MQRHNKSPLKQKLHSSITAHRIDSNDLREAKGGDECWMRRGTIGLWGGAGERVAGIPHLYGGGVPR